MKLAIFLIVSFLLLLASGFWNEVRPDDATHKWPEVLFLVASVFVVAALIEIIRLGFKFRDEEKRRRGLQ